MTSDGDPAAKCTTGNACVCSHCYMQLAHKKTKLHGKEYAHLKDVGQLVPLKDVHAAHMGMLARYGLVQGGTEKPVFYHRDHPQLKFTTIEAAMYNFCQVSGLVFDRDCFDDAMQLQRTNPPFPPLNVAFMMFKNAKAALCTNSTAEDCAPTCPCVVSMEDLTKLGARPEVKTYPVGSDARVCFEVYHSADNANGMSNKTRIVFRQGKSVATTRWTTKMLRAHPIIASDIASSKQPLSKMWEYNDAPSLRWPHTEKLDAAARSACRSAYFGSGVATAGDPGTYSGPGIQSIDGNLTPKSYTNLMTMANLNETSVFFDIGCSNALPCILARRIYSCRLALGVETTQQRLATAYFNIIKQKLRDIYLFNVAVEELSHYAPATHVFFFAHGMPKLLHAAVKHALAATKTLAYVIVSPDILMDVPGFHKVAASTATMAANGGSRRFYVYGRLDQPVPSVPHPIFNMPIHMSTLPGTLNPASLGSDGCLDAFYRCYAKHVSNNLQEPKKIDLFAALPAGLRPQCGVLTRRG